MKAKINALIDGLIMYDYILFGSVFVLFIVFILLGLLLRKKLFLAVTFILLAFFILILGPTLGFIKMHEYIFENSTVVTSQKRLQFTQAVVVRGSVTNTSNLDFKSCEITAKAHKVSANALKNYLYKYKKIKEMSVIETDIKKGETRDFKIILEPFTYTKDYNISIGADCK